ncbi:MAG: PASTA domain-containing protein [bacterium]|nr:PASTA domain-containing protein [bacterium]MDT8396573.1 PASTA domain-containing protein [bacterium]
MSRTGVAVRIVLLAAGMVLAAVLSAWVAFTFLTRGGEVEVPSLEGLELRAALELTSRGNLGLKVSGTGYDQGIPPGHIISQVPEARSRTRKNRIVRVVVSQGTPTVFVPQLAALTLRKAELSLAQAGLGLGKVGYVHHENTGSGRVITQVPPSGYLVPRGGKINLLMSEGPRPAVYLLPDLTGLPMDVVLDTIRGWGLKSGRISEVGSEELPPGTVMTHVPAPGSPVTAGQSVHLTVTRIPPPPEPATMVLYRYSAPTGLLDRTVAIVLDTGDGERTVWEDVVPAGSSIAVPVPVSGTGVLRVYVDEVLHEEKQVP